MKIIKTITICAFIAASYGCVTKPLSNPQRVVGSRLTPQPPTLLYTIKSHRAEQEFNVVEINSQKP